MIFRYVKLHFRVWQSSIVEFFRKNRGHVREYIRVCCRVDVLARINILSLFLGLLTPHLNRRPFITRLARLSLTYQAPYTIPLCVSLFCCYD